MLPMNFDSVLAAMQCPLPLMVTETIGNYEKGAWVETETDFRLITAIVLAMKTADLEFYRQGHAADSGICLHTKAELYFADAGNHDPQSGETRQSYVEYKGRRYRVSGTGLLGGNTTMRLYHCVRYLP